METKKKEKNHKLFRPSQYYVRFNAEEKNSVKKYAGLHGLTIAGTLRMIVLKEVNKQVS
jgi:hypothetical protein